MDTLSHALDMIRQDWHIASIDLTDTDAYYSVPIALRKYLFF